MLHGTLASISLILATLSFRFSEGRFRAAAAGAGAAAAPRCGGGDMVDPTSRIVWAVAADSAFVFNTAASISLIDLGAAAAGAGSALVFNTAASISLIDFGAAAAVGAGSACERIVGDCV